MEAQDKFEGVDFIIEVPKAKTDFSKLNKDPKLNENNISQHYYEIQNREKPNSSVSVPSLNNLQISEYCFFGTWSPFSFKDPSKLLKNILEILMNMGISGTSAINVETLIYQLIRVPDKQYERPDFSKSKVDFTIIPLSSSIQKSDIYTAFSFEKFKQQVTDIDSFKKTGNGIFDPLFKTKRPNHLVPVDKKLIQTVLATT